jgi:hypothetical protein
VQSDLALNLIIAPEKNRGLSGWLPRQTFGVIVRESSAKKIKPTFMVKFGNKMSL